ncbi:flap endonuclease GEN-like 2 isoform X1 [Canna indica]|uniref:Flap endonuclease GEN-like 2 isoform X1 n=1 Tax=Canna indica TaxID=4628 RepID=A0AAQ3L8C3_9LILI|nr:flap endonuclease GEN-like 2 isoform X1 [Canna indica]
MSRIRRPTRSPSGTTHCAEEYFIFISTRKQEKCCYAVIHQQDKARYVNHRIPINKEIPRFDFYLGVSAEPFYLTRRNKRLCVDLSCWLIQLQNAGRCVKEKIYLRNLFHRLRALIALNCSIILVADGSVPSIKLSTYRRRLGLCEVTQEDANSQAMSSVSLRRNRGSEFSCMVKEAKSLGAALGIPFLDGLEEAEAQCALLNMEALCDGCFSADSDIFLFGARTVYRDIFLGDNGYVICYEMDDIEQKLGFGRNSLIALAVLLGSDYSHGVHGFGRASACQIVKSLGDDSVLHQIMSETLKIERNYKGKKKIGKSASSDVNKENEQGLKSVCGSAPNYPSNAQYFNIYVNSILVNTTKIIYSSYLFNMFYKYLNKQKQYQHKE